MLTFEHIFWPDEFNNVTPELITPNPLTIAVINEPAGEPIYGDTERNYGVKVIPVLTVRSSVPSGRPIGR
jgi:hypothetical protein